MKKLVAILLVVVMVFSVSPAFAWTTKTRTWEEVHEEGKTWGFWGMVGGAVLAAGATIVTGGAALPFIIGAGTAGAVVGGAGGYVTGAIGENGREMVGTGVAVVGAIAAGQNPSPQPVPQN